MATVITKLGGSGAKVGGKMVAKRMGKGVAKSLGKRTFKKFAKKSGAMTKKAMKKIGKKASKQMKKASKKAMKKISKKMKKGSNKGDKGNSSGKSSTQQSSEKMPGVKPNKGQGRKRKSKKGEKKPPDKEGEQKGKEKKKGKKQGKKSINAKNDKGPRIKGKGVKPASGDSSGGKKRRSFKPRKFSGPMPPSRSESQSDLPTTTFSDTTTIGSLPEPHKPRISVTQLDPNSKLKLTRAAPTQETMTTEITADQPSSTTVGSSVITETQQTTIEPSVTSSLPPPARPVLRDSERPVLRDSDRPGIRDLEKPVLRDSERPGIRDSERPGVRDSERPVSISQDGPPEMLWKPRAKPSRARAKQRPSLTRRVSDTTARSDQRQQIHDKVKRDVFKSEAAKAMDDPEFNLMLFRLAKHIIMEGSVWGGDKERKKKKRGSDWLKALNMVLNAQNGYRTEIPTSSQNFECQCCDKKCATRCRTKNRKRHYSKSESPSSSWSLSSTTSSSYSTRSYRENTNRFCDVIRTFNKNSNRCLGPLQLSPYRQRRSSYTHCQHPPAPTISSPINQYPIYHTPQALPANDPIPYATFPINVPVSSSVEPAMYAGGMIDPNVILVPDYYI